MIAASTWPDVAIVAFGVIQVIVLALIAMRQAQVKRDLQTYNGRQEAKLDRLPEVVEAVTAEQTGHLAAKVDAVPENVLEAAVRRGVEIEIARTQAQE